MTRGRPLFVFGTLLDPAIRAAVMGKASPGRPAVLHGFERRRVVGAEYPALRRRIGGRVRGLLLPAPDAPTLARLDAHEGEEYVRRAIWVEAGRRLRRADCYLAAPAARLSRQPWAPDARWGRRREGYRRRQVSSASSRTIA